MVEGLMNAFEGLNTVVEISTAVYALAFVGGAAVGAGIEWLWLLWSPDED